MASMDVAAAAAVVEVDVAAVERVGLGFFAETTVFRRVDAPVD